MDTILGAFPYRVYIKKTENNGRPEITLSYRNGKADGRMKTVYWDEDMKSSMRERKGDFHCLTEDDFKKAVDKFEKPSLSSRTINRI
ncbi:MAG: hypothetical protein QMD85_02155 [Candidatus Aenigmarchaeota archaeon]|nr:hypothetical protein [Candidatus Aenigmarchaeota archaeon]MDI6722353.1 hypothetical protein [Candidatus Aenigmarchaeota archaeon]